MYNSRNVQKTFLYTIDNPGRMGYNTHRWSEQPSFGRHFDVLGHIAFAETTNP